MAAIGWEFYGIKFSMFITMAIAVIMYMYIMLSTHNSGQLSHIDGMAGDEGED